MKGHICRFSQGKIKDVTVRKGKIIYCKRCGGELGDSEVDPDTLNFIRNKFAHSGNR